MTSELEDIGQVPYWQPLLKKDGWLEPCRNTFSFLERYAEPLVPNEKIRDPLILNAKDDIVLDPTLIGSDEDRAKTIMGCESFVYENLMTASDVAVFTYTGEPHPAQRSVLSLLREHYPENIFTPTSRRELYRAILRTRLDQEERPHYWVGHRREKNNLFKDICRWNVDGKDFILDQRVVWLKMAFEAKDFYSPPKAGQPSLIFSIPEGAISGGPVRVPEFYEHIRKTSDQFTMSRYYAYRFDFEIKDLNQCRVIEVPPKSQRT